MGAEALWSAAALVFDRRAQALWTWAAVLAMEQKAQNVGLVRVLA